ncbi:hypothetical protein [Streptomyces caniscabiei]|uniref:hypothetical protein n=1 Tax=Streptomyces caniscabiei TaxID=2746961 RepID=UPI0007658E86|nr:hypothetical protein [Streptomyces caniscabiei]
MGYLKMRIASAIVAGGAALGVLGSPGTASAADSTQVSVCDTGNTAVTFWIGGYNQNGQWVNSREWKISPGKCTAASGYWWKKEDGIDVHYTRNGKDWKVWGVYVHASDQVITLSS